MPRGRPRRGRGVQSQAGLTRYLGAAQRRGQSQRSALAEWRARGHSVRDVTFRQAWHAERRRLPEQRLHRGRRPAEGQFQRVRVQEGPTRYVYHVQVLVSAPRIGTAWQMVQVASSTRITPKRAEDIAGKLLGRTERYRVSVLDARLEYVTKEIGPGG